MRRSFLTLAIMALPYAASAQFIETSSPFQPQVVLADATEVETPVQSPAPEGSAMLAGSINDPSSDLADLGLAPPGSWGSPSRGDSDE